MLFRITRDCGGECSHCLIDATRNGLHMNSEVVEASIKFMGKVRPRLILVTGGEPFDHPQIFDIIQKLKDTTFSGQIIVITSNGIPLQDKDMYDKALATGVSIQVVNDPKYYPHRVVLPGPEIPVIDYVGAPIYPAGRALTNGLNCTAKAPSCFNLRSISRHVTDFRNLISALEEKNRFCTPVIDYDGSIKLGEHNLCPAVSTIYEEPNEVLKRIVNFKCNRCKLFDGLSKVYKDAVGEE